MLTSADLLDPVGQIIASLFPSDTLVALQSRLDAYLVEGYLKAAGVGDSDTRDSAARHWAYYRSYTQVVIRMSSESASVNVGGQLSVSILAEQIKNFSRLAADHLAAFNEIVATGVDDLGAQPAPLASTTTCMVATW